jgi:hypothetical protein
MYNKIDEKEKASILDRQMKNRRKYTHVTRNHGRELSR